MQPTQRPSLPPILRTLAMLLAGAAFLAVAAPALASEAGGSDRSWGAFLGRTHVLVLHLPIGLLIGAFAIEFFGLFRRSKGFDIAAAWLFLLGFLSSIIAVFTGLLLGTEVAGNESLNIFNLLFADAEEGVSDTLGLHMWLGVTLMVISGVAAVLKIMAVRRQWVDKESSVPARGGWPLGLARVSLIGVMAVMPLVGHLGGNMTKQPTYLFERAPFDVPASLVYWPEQPPEVQVVKGKDGEEFKPDGSVAAWVNVVQPALDNACVKCHGPSKQKADIRLDTLKYAVESDGVEYAVITEEDAQFSALYTVITLPKSHEMFMPPDPKDAFDYELVEFIGEWIQNYDGRLEDPQPVRAEAGDDGTPEGPKPVIDPAALGAITAAGGNAQSLSQEENPDELTVKFAYLKELDPAVVAKLESGADKIAWLTFEGSSFGDDAAKALPDMPKLTKLNLKDSAITDAGLPELPELPAVTWLNLFGTEVSDAGLDALKKYGTLEKLYLTGTKVTAEGVEALREAMPGTEIFSDHDGQFQFNPVTPEVTPGDPAKDDKAATEQAAKPVNDKCPVSGAPVKAGFVSTFEGKAVG
ncbi:MAG: hypothetical protein KTR15_12410, partial [Phycisphaeraceae bacterium]|nr:hypothetical protein [Phycisphaeraceae bacterium]